MTRIIKKMKLIIGLGNFEDKYLFTRHNAGFMAVDFFAQQNNGNFKTNLYVNSVSIVGAIPTPDSITNVAIGDYVLNGKDSVNNITLTESVWTYWKDYVRQRIYGRQNYNDAGKQDYFTTAQKNEIIALFANNQKDDLAPPQYDFDLDLEL